MDVISSVHFLYIKTFQDLHISLQLDRIQDLTFFNVEEYKTERFLLSYQYSIMFL